MQIGAANPTSANAQDEMACFGFRPRYFGNPERVLRNILRRGKNSGFHGIPY
jgi:hypothetical protein